MEGGSRKAARLGLLASMGWLEEGLIEGHHNAVAWLRKPRTPCRVAGNGSEGLTQGRCGSRVGGTLSSGLMSRVPA